MENKQYWFAAYTKARHEKSVAERLQQQDIEIFLPVIREKKRWTDRTKEIITPLIKSYLFVNIEPKNLLYVLQTYGVCSVVKIGGKYTKIPEYQISALKKALEERVSLTPEKYFHKGELVQVLTGPLKGKMGRIINIQVKTKLLLNIDTINYAFSTPISPENVKKVAKNSKGVDL